MIEIDIICPVYKEYHLLEPLYKSFYKQKNVIIKNIVFPLTIEGEELDKIKAFIKEKKILSFDVLKDEFSHSLTREKAMREYCTSNIVVMISQDIKLKDENVFYNLISSIVTGETVYNYARQICTNNSIERYIRQKNYPLESLIISREDISKLQLMAFFASDACSAYNREVFLALGGYGGYDVMMNEDQLYSKSILEAGYKKKYCADAVVEHSHKYTLKQLYKRYYDTGVFYKNIKMFDGYRMSNSGFKLAKYVLIQAIKHFNIPVLFRWGPDMAARYFGMRKGKKEKGGSL